MNFLEFIPYLSTSFPVPFHLYFSHYGRTLTSLLGSPATLASQAAVKVPVLCQLVMVHIEITFLKKYYLGNIFRNPSKSVYYVVSSFTSKEAS